MDLSWEDFSASSCEMTIEFLSLKGLLAVLSLQMKCENIKTSELVSTASDTVKSLSSTFILKVEVDIKDMDFSTWGYSVFNADAKT